MLLTINKGIRSAKRYLCSQGSCIYLQNTKRCSQALRTSRGFTAVDLLCRSSLLIDAIRARTWIRSYPSSTFSPSHHSPRLRSEPGPHGLSEDMATSDVYNCGVRQGGRLGIPRLQPKSWKCCSGSSGSIGVLIVSRRGYATNDTVIF